MHDLKFALRQLRKSPGFTVAVVLTLGVGIGINVAMYSIIHAVLLSELPFPEADRLVAISETWPDGISPMSYPDYLDWKTAQHSFDEIAVSRRDDFNLTGNGEPERVSGLFVTASYFRVLKIPPKLGRTFFDEEDSVAGVNPVVLSEHLWRSRFAADPSVVGRKLILNTISYEVVGVAAESLSIIRNPETARNSQGAVGLKLPSLKYRDTAQQAAFYQQLLEKVEALPGVATAAVEDDVPFSGFRATENFTVTGQPESQDGQQPIAETHCVSPDYFKAMRIPILRGRVFGRDDVLGKPLVIVIDEYLARTFFLNQDPIGQQLSQERLDKTTVQHTIVGIVPSVRHGEPGIAPKIPQIYWPAAQFPSLQETLLVRTASDPRALLPSIRAVVHAIDPQLPVFAMRTMDEAIAASIATHRSSATLVGAFSILALFLGALGLYGVLAYSVTRRTREIGIRIALGSPRAKICGLIVRQGIIMVGWGFCLASWYR